jgi:hypothetical protein
MAMKVQKGGLCIATLFFYNISGRRGECLTPLSSGFTLSNETQEKAYNRPGKHRTGGGWVGVSQGRYGKIRKISPAHASDSQTARFVRVALSTALFWPLKRACPY